MAARRPSAFATTKSSAATIATASGINGEFLCVKGRYAFDFNESEERLTTPMIRANGELKPASWSDAIRFAAGKLKQVKESGGKIGVVGSMRTTNEENFYLQKFARQVLGTNHIDHARSGDLITLFDALAGRTGCWPRPKTSTPPRPFW